MKWTVVISLFSFAFAVLSVCMLGIAAMQMGSAEMSCCLLYSAEGVCPMSTFTHTLASEAQFVVVPLRDSLVGILGVVLVLFFVLLYERDTGVDGHTKKLLYRKAVLRDHHVAFLDFLKEAFSQGILHSRAF